VSKEDAKEKMRKECKRMRVDGEGKQLN